MGTKIRLGDLIASLYDEVIKETKNKSVQSVIVLLALNDLQRRYGVARKPVKARGRSAA